MAITYPISEVKEDLEMAEKILLGKTNVSYDEGFNSYSFVYRTTNEALNEYVDHFNGKRKMLSVIASGDQIINAILSGVEEVDAFDISRLPKYFLMLKLAAVQALTLDEYIDFFYTASKKAGPIRELKYYRMFVKMSKYLDPLCFEFWNKFLKRKFWGNIYNSKLFSDQEIKPREIAKNIFLESKNYDRTRSLVADSNIRIKTGNIFELVKTYGPKDIVYLSNIIDYSGGLDRYANMLRELKLTPQGEAITYCFDNLGLMTRGYYFKSRGHKFERLSNGDALMISRDLGGIYGKTNISRRR